MENLLLKDDSVYVDEIELLTLLIDKWDNKHTSFNPDGLENQKTSNAYKSNDLQAFGGLQSQNTPLKIVVYVN